MLGYLGERAAGTVRTGWLICGILLSMCLPGRAGADEHLLTARVFPEPPRAEPAYMWATTDAEFGSPLVRVTDPGGLIQVVPSLIWGSPAVHHYSSAQAWNADQSLLAIEGGVPGYVFLDGATYQPRFQRTPPLGDCEWHPTDPELMICVGSEQAVLWDVRNDTSAVAYANSAYSSWYFGPWKGNPSFDGRYIAVRAQDQSGAAVAFAVDLVNHRKGPTIPLSPLPGTNNHVSISASGRYIFVFQNNGPIDQAHVFTRWGVPVQHWLDNHCPGHGDMTLDPADGSDVYVGICKSDPYKYHVIKRRLRDGAITDLSRYSQAQHVSTRSIGRPGWAVVTYSGTWADVAGNGSWMDPFYQEVLALKIDGSGDIKRLAQTRTVANGYDTEAHGSPSPDLSRVIFGSNWGAARGPVAAYVVDVPW